MIILQDGKLIEHNLKHERLTEDEVAAAARQQQIGSLDDVAWAVLEGERPDQLHPPRLMPLYLSEHDVESLLSPGEAVPVIEACFRRLAAGTVENVPRRRLRFEAAASR